MFSVSLGVTSDDGGLFYNDCFHGLFWSLFIAEGEEEMKVFLPPSLDMRGGKGRERR